MGCLRGVNGLFTTAKWGIYERQLTLLLALKFHSDCSSGRGGATLGNEMPYALLGPQLRGHSRWLNAACSSPFNRMVCSCFSFKKYIVFVYVCIYARAGVGNASDLNLIAIGCTTKAVFSLFFGSIFTLHPLIHRSALGETPHKFQ